MSQIPDVNQLMEERRKAVAESIHPVTYEELKVLGEKLFPFTDHPWRQAYFEFLEQHRTERFHHGTTQDRIDVIYCQDQNRGLWYMKGGGVGLLQEGSLKILKEIVEKG